MPFTQEHKNIQKGPSLHPETLPRSFKSHSYFAIWQGYALTIICVIWGFRSVVDEKHSVLEYDDMLIGNLLTNFQRFFFPPLFKVD